MTEQTNGLPNPAEAGQVETQPVLVEAVASALALAIMKRTLREGKSISIPSLDITIPGDKVVDSADNT